MPQNVIHLLPDSVANQIAAGEVIQRPASVIKELMENSIDAGADDVRVSVQDAGRTLIQVSDNGCGMSETDARLAFERHATSKIGTATDLYALHTMGFRGEALASIAAVAQVELQTRRHDEELGIKIEIAGSKVETQEPCATACGSRFSVKNIFFNTPARRRFLKSDNAELRHISTEFLRVALAHPDVTTSLTSDGKPMYTLPKGNTKQRVSAVAGKALAQNLLPVDTETSVIKIHGFIGTAETARKSGGDQYFFVNNRFMKSGYLHKAVIDAYKNIMPQDMTPAYFIYMTADPQTIDVNVHPQKTEIKFDDDQAVWKILNAAVRESLGRYNILPSIDFDSSDKISIPTYIPNTTTSYNPFAREMQQTQNFAMTHFGHREPSPKGWEDLYAQAAGNATTVSKATQTGTGNSEGTIFGTEVSQPSGADDIACTFQLQNRYIVAQTRTGIIIVDQRRASERIQYDTLRAAAANGTTASQQLMFPEVIDMGADDACIVEELSGELSNVGLEATYDSGAGQLKVTSIPPTMTTAEVSGMIDALIYDYRNGEIDLQNGIMDYIARTLASHSAIPYGKTLTTEEMSSICERLFASDSPSLSPSGKTTFTTISVDEMESRLRQ